MLNAVRSLAIWTVILLLTLFLFWPGLVFALFGAKNGAGGHWWAARWARLIYRVHPSWKLLVDQSRLPLGRPFVIVCNHQSTADIIINFHLDHHFKFISKTRNFRMPVIGWYMRLCGYIPLERASRSSIARCLDLSRQKLRAGVSVLFYPEGTRSLDGRVQPFKPGAFRLAVGAGVDVLPVAVAGTGGLLPKNSLLISKEETRVKMVVGDPIPVAGLGEKDIPALAERARQEIGRASCRERVYVLV